MKGLSRKISLISLALSSSGLNAQIALEFARIEERLTSFPLIEKGGEEASSDYKSGLYYSDNFEARSMDLHDPVWVEFFLNHCTLFQAHESFEVLYLIPENELETLVICRTDERLGYFRIIQITRSEED